MRATSLAHRRLPLAQPRVQLAHIEEVSLDHEFDALLEQHGFWPLKPTRISTLQINLGRVCNMTCVHCHVDAGPDRREAMSRDTLESCLQVIASNDIPTVDITGGAPEFHPEFRWLVEQARALGRKVIDRCNLTILEYPAYRDLPAFFAQHEVELVCSLPHYRSLLTDRQRGEGTFERSLSALRRLNDVGYGKAGSGLRLVLVANPVGAFLPAAQASLEREWKRELFRLYGVSFDSLYCMTNMPIARYLEWLLQTGNLESYLQRLAAAFNPAAAASVMCRTTLSVGWDGRLHDCDFNQMLDLGVEAEAPEHIDVFDRAALEARSIVVRRHCFGCTAGAGSSCGGSTT
jgi:radical SAM/Cys-rich protein